VNDQQVDAGLLVRRRDELLADLDRLYQFAFGVDHAAHERLRLPHVVDDRAA
jgi:hypothetical protein